MKKYLCLGCGFSYDEARGLPEHGIAPGTRWTDVPDDRVCPDCGTPKSGFEMVEIPYWSEARPSFPTCRRPGQTPATSRAIPRARSAATPASWPSAR
ncbi:MAG: rubredoxin [Rhodospirillales bacterium]|nr:rubredoxin [Rhodospirillales bacterium]